MGKVPYGILKEAQKEHIPVIVLAGSIENLPELNKAGFKGIFSIAPGPITLEKAMKPEFAKENITRLVSQLYSVITLRLICKPLSDKVISTKRAQLLGGF